MNVPSIQWLHRRLILLIFAALIVAVPFAVWLGPGNGWSVIRTKLTSEVARSSAVPNAEACATDSAERTRRVITTFLSAYNAGTADITDMFIAPAGEFQWYGAPDRAFPDNPASMDRETLPAYFAAKHASGERLELRDFSFNGSKYDPDIHESILNFGYTLTHTVGGSNPKPAPGKGALGCKSGKIVLWLIDSW